MLPILSVLLVVTLSIIVNRIATVALVFTGLSQETARFQSFSAFLGVGFTTSESESLVKHPVRRRILFILMLLGNVGIVTVISSLILTFLQQDVSHSGMFKIGVLAGGIVILWILGSSKWVDRQLFKIIERALQRYTTLYIHDYAAILDLEGEYKISEMTIEPDEWLAGKALSQAKLRDEGIIVLSIRRTDGSFIGAPRGYTQIEAGDNIVVYGREPSVKRLVARRTGSSGDVEHQQAVIEQRQILSNINQEPT